MKPIYTSKKHPEVTAEVVKQPNDTTVILRYLTGNEVGKSITITTGTFKRYWKKTDVVEESKSALDVLGVDAEKLNEPYKPEVTPHYIPKPESVKEYEEKKKRVKVDVPEFETIVDQIGFICSKVNTGFVRLRDSKTTIWRKAGGVYVYADNDVWEALTKSGFTSKPNKDKDRPYAFEIKDMDSYNTLVDSLVKYIGG